MLSVTSESIPDRTKISGARPERCAKLTNSSMVLLLLCKTRVDDVLDARDGDGRLGDVSREDDLAVVRRCRCESLCLLSWREFGV